MITSTTN